MAIEDAIVEALTSQISNAPQDSIDALAHVLLQVLNGSLAPNLAGHRMAQPDLAPLLQPLAGHRLSLPGAVITVAEHLSITGDVGVIQQIQIAKGVQAGDIIGVQIVIEVAQALQFLQQVRAPVGDFIGRDRELDHIASYLIDKGSRSAPVVVISGMAGVGKTELAYAVVDRLAETFSDATLFINLHGPNQTPLTPTMALRRIIQATGDTGVLPEQLGELIARYRGVLSGRRAIVIADNAYDAAQLRPLLPPRGVALLVTSRQRLALSGALLIDLSPLGQEAAQNLLQIIYPRIGSDTAALAKACGFLPLALRISASLLLVQRYHTVAELLAELQREKLSVLADPQAVDDPEVSVAASLRLSYSALPDAAQRAFIQFAIFPAPFSPTAALAVLDEPGTDVALALLDQHHLLQWDQERQLYTFHDLVRAFALSLQSPSPVHQRRYVDWYLKQLLFVADQLKGDAQIKALAAIDGMYPHLLESLAICDSAQRLRIAAALWGYWELRGALREGLSWLRRALAEAPQERNLWSVIANAQTGAGALARARGAYPSARRYVLASLRMRERLGDHHGQAKALNNLAQLDLLVGNHVRAQESFTASLAGMREANDRWGAAIVSCNLGMLEHELGDFPEAVRLLTSGIADLEALGDQSSVAMYLENLGFALLAFGDVQGAEDRMRSSLRLREALDDQWGLASVHQALGKIAVMRGQLSDAVNHYSLALRLVDTLGDDEGQILTIEGIGALALAYGDATICARVLGAARAARVKYGIVLPDVDQPYQQQLVVAATAILGASTYASAQAGGELLTLPDAMREAVATVGTLERSADQ